MRSKTLRAGRSQGPGKRRFPHKSQHARALLAEARPLTEDCAAYSHNQQKGLAGSGCLELESAVCSLLRLTGNKTSAPTAERDGAWQVRYGRSLQMLLKAERHALRRPLL